VISHHFVPHTPHSSRSAGRALHACMMHDAHAWSLRGRAALAGRIRARVRPLLALLISFLFLLWGGTKKRYVVIACIYVRRHTVTAVFSNERRLASYGVHVQLHTTPYPSHRFQLFSWSFTHSIDCLLICDMSMLLKKLLRKGVLPLLPVLFAKLLGQRGSFWMNPWIVWWKDMFVWSARTSLAHL